MHVRTPVTAALLAVGLAVPAPAHAVTPQQVLAYSGGYLLSEVTVVQGGTLTLTNADAATMQYHDVVALNFSGGRPVFRSALIPPGQQSLVAGVERLAPSVYPFYCSVHDYMVGNITVVEAPAR